MSNPPAISSPSSPGWSRWIERLRVATAGRFTIIRELGRGGFAAVFLAQQIQPNRRVAIKLLMPAHLDSQWALEHFRGESQKIAEWRHQSVVTIYEVHEVDDLFFFVMSYVEGGSLHDLISVLGPLSVPITRSVLAQVGSALQYAHRQGVTHRDIKPHNVLIDVDGGAVVTDFGISKQSGGTSHTVTGMIFGTAPYMAPEQCESGITSIHSDQYALGIVVYEMMTGSPPFTGTATSVLMAHLQKPVPPLRSIRPDCPPELEAAVARMLAKKPADRFASIAEAIQAAGAMELPEYSQERQQFAQAARSMAARSDAHVLELVSIPPTLEVGDRIPLHASAKTMAGVPVAETEIRWSVENDRVARFDSAKSELTALTPGFTTLFVRSGGAEQQVRVDVKPPQVATIRLDGPTGPMRIGEKTRLTAFAQSRHGLPVSGPTIWVSEDPTLATVTPDGVLQALGAGRTRIRAQMDNVSSEFWLEVAPAAVAEVRIMGAPSSLTIGDRRQLSAVVLDASDQVLTDRTVQWTSSDRRVATVSPMGMVTASTAGNVEITATCDAFFASVRVAVAEPQAVIVEVLNPPIVLRMGDSARLRAVARDAQGHGVDRPISWTSDDSSVARVAADGMLSAVAPGMVTISASIDGITTSTSLEIARRPSLAVPADESKSSVFSAGTAPATETPKARKVDEPAVPLGATAILGVVTPPPKVSTPASTASIAATPAPAAAAPPSIPAPASTPTPIQAPIPIQTPAARPVAPPLRPSAPVADAPVVAMPSAPAAKPVPPVVAAPSLPASVASAPVTADNAKETIVASGGLSRRTMGIAAIAAVLVISVVYAVTRGGGAKTEGAAAASTPDAGTTAAAPSPAPTSPPVTATTPSSPGGGTRAPAPSPEGGAAVRHTIKIVPVNVPIAVGDSFTLHVTGEAAAISKIRWSSSAPAVASVSRTGVITAKKAGRVSIVATAEDLHDIINIAVQAKTAVAAAAQTKPGATQTNATTEVAPPVTPPVTPPSPPPARIETPPPVVTAPVSAATPPASGSTAPIGASTPNRDAAADQRRVRQLVTDYASALTAKNLPDAIRHFPSMSDPMRKGWQDFFQGGSDVRVQYDVASMDLKPTTGNLKLTGFFEFTPPKAKSKCRFLVSISMRVEQVDASWRIAALDQKILDSKGCGG